MSKVTLAFAIDRVESLFPYRFIKRQIGNGRSYSTVYRPSYLLAVKQLEKLLEK